MEGTFSREFKIEAVQRMTERGMTVVQACRDPADTSTSMTVGRSSSSLAVRGGNRSRLRRQATTAGTRRRHHRQSLRQAARRGHQISPGLLPRSAVLHQAPGQKPAGRSPDRTGSRSARPQADKAGGFNGPGGPGTRRTVAPDVARPVGGPDGHRAVRPDPWKHTIACARWSKTPCTNRNTPTCPLPGHPARPASRVPAIAAEPVQIPLG